MGSLGKMKVTIQESAGMITAGSGKDGPNTVPKNRIKRIESGNDQSKLLLFMILWFNDYM